MSTTRNDSSMNESKTKIPALMWAFTIVLALGAALGGYLIGLNEGRDQVPAPAVAAPAENTQAQQPADFSDVEPGTDFSVGDNVDATIYGGGDDGEVGRRNANDPMGIGAVDAPIVISEFSSFGCPYCARHNTQTEQHIIDEYVDTGLVRLEWNDLPINGPNSEDAARAGRAAAAQGKFFEFKDALFADFESRGGQFTADDFLRYAEEAGVENLDQFAADAASDTYDEAINGSRQFGAGLGINGTPSFVIGTQIISGALPFEQFEQVINAELVKAQN
ncbi:DsbA family protein [Corynebacterium cystitidis]|uniref:DsbA family protein n=1 Tax=Corynebacterium cystitidis TaxID=35757 RepID=UPI00211E21FF|nr:thioredoxin domain-containing protein [Corynebacterium cystitidis]